MINSAVIVGRLTKDPEIRKTQSGLSVCQFTVAVNRPKSKDGQQQADFIQCQAWRASADYIGTYGRKGYLVGVSGRIQTRNYEDRDGNKVYVTEIVCNDVNILESKKSSKPDYPSYGNSIRTDSIDTSGAYEGEDGSPISADDLPF